MKNKWNSFRMKRVWPMIVLSISVSVVIFFLILYGVNIVITYIFQSKIDMLVAQTYHISAMVEKNLSYGQDLDEAIKVAEQVTLGLGIESKRAGELGKEMPISQICVVDQNGKVVANSSTSEPVLEEAFQISPNSEYVLYRDSEDEFFSITDKTLQQYVLELSLNSYKNRSELRSTPFKKDDYVFSQDFWVKLEVEKDGCTFYQKCNLFMFHEEFSYTFMGGMVVLLLLLFPLLFLLINTIKAITRQKKTAKLLYTDSVTGEFNWQWFQAAFTKFNSKRKRKKYMMMGYNRFLKVLKKNVSIRKTYAVVDLQMDRYKNYCAGFGTKEGEDMLLRIGVFLKARLLGRDFCARHSNADFALFLTCKGNDQKESETYCYHRLRTLLAELTGVESLQKLRFYAGVYLIHDFEENDFRKDYNADQCFNYASYALEKCRTQKKEQIFFFDEEMLEKQKWQQFLEEYMEDAIKKEEFQVYLQPKYNPRENRIVGAEALARWENPKKGVVPPSLFIPVFEENGFINRLDDYMISKVAKLEAEWTLAKKRKIPISVNISRSHFTQDDLATHILRLVDAYGTGHELVELEVTESAFFEDKDSMIDTVKQLKRYGFSVSMDDFGAGYSSLNSLKDIPLDVLKLDAEFFRGSPENKNRERIIVREAVALAKSLQMQVVAEGIEHKEQVEFLSEIGCDMIQGYYYGRPMPIDEFEKLIDEEIKVQNDTDILETENIV